VNSLVANEKKDEARKLDSQKRCGKADADNGRADGVHEGERPRGPSRETLKGSQPSGLLLLVGLRVHRAAAGMPFLKAKTPWRDVRRKAGTGARR